MKKKAPYDLRYMPSLRGIGLSGYGLSTVGPTKLNLLNYRPQKEYPSQKKGEAFEL